MSYYNDGLETNNIKVKFIELTQEINIIKSFVDSNSVVFDIGANVGDWTKEVLNECPEVKIHLFEPVPQTYQVLLRNLSEPIEAGKVIPNNFAVAHQEEIRTFYCYESSPSWSTFNRRLSIETQFSLAPPELFPIFTTTVDDYCKRLNIKRINFLKIDTEGSELDIIKGTKHLLERGQVDFLQFEYGGTFLDSQITLKQVFEILQQYRYSIFKIFSKGLEYRPQFLPEYEDYEYTNFLAVNERFTSNLLGEAPKMLELHNLCAKYSITPHGVIHIGAHDGKEIQCYQAMNVHKILLIEANPAVFERLKANIAGIPNVQAVNCAISNMNGDVTLHVTSMDQSSSILPLKYHSQLYPNIIKTHQVVVESKMLDTLLEELQLKASDFNLLNIDIQGAELLALQGATNCLKHVEAVNTEVNYKELYEGCALIDQIDDFLEIYGFERVATKTPYDSSWGDAFYVKKSVITMSTLGQNGRFANQIFQYAFLKIYAKENNSRVETPAWIGQYLFGHNELPICEQLPLVLEETNELAKARIPNSRTPYKNVDFWGYFQYNTKYYAPHKEYFRSLFKPVAQVERKMRAALESLRSRGKTIIGLHLRRGDYGYEHFFVAPSEWYKEWLKGLWETVDEPVLFIASDEKEKIIEDFLEYNPVTSQHLGIELPEAEFYPDFYLLSNCDIVAISNSSFSFAACLLNEQGKLFFRPHLKTKKLIPFDPWNSETIFRDVKAPYSITVNPIHRISNSEISSFINLDVQGMEKSRLSGEIKDARPGNAVDGLDMVVADSADALTCDKSSVTCPETDDESLNLPIHFFTIVLNGEPFIRYHIEVLKQLPFKWHWHIVEGVADLKHDTAWVLEYGGRIIDEMHCNGRSNDGTTEYLDELAQQYPHNITVYRKPEGVFWDGKREMVNAPLTNIHEECLLWQVDADELWTAEQIFTVRQLFINNPGKTAAFYWCWYFVGENLIITTRNCYAQNPHQEWLRTWRFKPGDIWASHEAPRLVEPLLSGEWRDVAAVNPFLHQETEQLGLIFQHFAYVTPEQLGFKEQYYGYANAVSEWRKLQAQTQFPVLLRDYFSWVQDATIVDIASSYNVIPIAQKEAGREVWRFLQPEELQRQLVEIEKPSPTIIIDSVLQSYQSGITRVWKSLLKEWAHNGFAKHIIVLDRAGTAPKIPGIEYLLVPPYNDNISADREMLQQVCNQQAANLFISTYYTAPISTPSVLMVYDLIPEALGWDAEHPSRRAKHLPIQQASAYITISESTARDLVRFFTDILPDSVTVAHCGLESTFSPASLEEVKGVKTKYGISKPYFILVGLRTGYKNTVLFFKAFSQLCSKQGFDIVCIGGESALETEFRNYTLGSVVHMLQLSDEELRAAYSGAVALVYPSEYEGFGLPILEAIACGCPIITCPNSSIPEVAGEAALYVNETDVDGLANALCEVQKPELRRSLIAAGIQQAKKFSWSKMAKTVSSALIDATLLPLNLQDSNFIIFPDWTQPEECLSIDLERVLKAIATHPDRNRITLLVDNSNIAEEEASLILSGVTMNMIMQEDLDITEGLEISLTGKLSKIQWEALLPRVQARIILEREDKQVIAQVKAEAFTAYDLEGFNRQVRQFFFELSNKLFHEGRWQETIYQYEKLLEFQVGDAELYWRLSECFKQLNLPDRSVEALQEGIRLYPLEARLYFTLIFNLQANGCIQKAIVIANTATDLLPNDYTFKIVKNLILPIIYETQDEINFYRQRFIRGLQDLIQQTLLETPEQQKDALAGISRVTNFYLAHQGKNDIELQRQYGNLVHKIMAANYPKWVAPLSMPLFKDNKIRIGYVSAYLHSYSGTLWLTGWLRHCDRQSFEIYCYYTGNEPDAVTKQFQDYSDVFYYIPHNLEAVCEQIIADELHVLVFPEIGMNPQTMQMAGLRLAPVQCVAWGHPVTSGLPTIDYFLSSKLMEPENGREHYSEMLVCLPNIGVSYPKPYIPPITKSRSDFQLKDDAIIYLCSQAPFKYLPQYDFIFAEIAHRVPQAQFVFLRGSLLQQRLNRAFSGVGLKSEDYCAFLSVPERLDYLAINLLSDVYLDTISWSGGNTTLEAIACHLPVVTCPGEFMRGLHSYSFLKMIGVTDTIAQNEVEYIEIAVKLGLEAAWRCKIGERVKEGHDCLYDDKACVSGLESFYKQVVREKLTRCENL